MLVYGILESVNQQPTRRRAGGTGASEVTTLNQYRTDLERIESGEIPAEMAGDPAYAARVIHRELTTAAWHSWARNEARELTGRAAELVRRLEEANR